MHLNQSIKRALPTWIRCSLAPRAKLGRVHLVLKGTREQIVLAPKAVHEGGGMMRWLHVLHRWGNRTKPETQNTIVWESPSSKQCLSLPLPPRMPSSTNVLIIVRAQSHHLRLLLPRANLCASRWSTDMTLSLILPHWAPLWGTMPSTALHTPANPYVLIEGGGKVHISQRTSGLSTTTIINGYHVPSTYSMSSTVQSVFHVWSQSILH